MSPDKIGIIAAIAALSSWTISSFAFTTASRRANPGSINRVRILYAFILLTFLVTIPAFGVGSFNYLTQINKMQYMWFGLSGLVGLTLGDYYFFNGLRILGARRGSIFICIAPAATFLTGLFLLQEHLSWIAFAGMTLSIVGVFSLFFLKYEQQGVVNDGYGDIKKGISFALLGGACQGIGLVFAKKGFQVPGISIGALTATWIRMLSATVSVYLVGAFKINLLTEFRNITFSREKLLPVFAGTIFGPVIAICFSLYAAENLKTVVAQTLFSLLPLSILMTSVLFKLERVPPRSYLAVCISIAGILMLIWQQS